MNSQPSTIDSQLDQVRALAEGRATPELFAAMRAEARGRLVAARKPQAEPRPLAKIIPFDANALMAEKERDERIGANRRFGQQRFAEAQRKSADSPLARRIVAVLSGADSPMTSNEIGDALRSEREIINHYLRALHREEQVEREGEGNKCDPYRWRMA